MEEPINQFSKKSSVDEEQKQYMASFQDMNPVNRKSEFYEIGEIVISYFALAKKRMVKLPQSKIRAGIFALLFIIVALPITIYGLLHLFSSKPVTNNISYSSRQDEIGILTAVTITPIPSLTSTLRPTITPTPSLVPSSTSLPSIEGCVLGNSVWVRSKPKKTSMPIGEVAFDDCYEFIYRSEQEDGIWLGFIYENESDYEIGWVFGPLIKINGDLNLIENVDN